MKTHKAEELAKQMETQTASQIKGIDRKKHTQTFLENNGASKTHQNMNACRKREVNWRNMYSHITTPMHQQK